MVVNAPQSNIVSAAELTVGLLLARPGTSRSHRLVEERRVEASQVHRRRAL